VYNFFTLAECIRPLVGNNLLQAFGFRLPVAIGGPRLIPHEWYLLLVRAGQNKTSGPLTSHVRPLRATNRFNSSVWSAHCLYIYTGSALPARCQYFWNYPYCKYTLSFLCIIHIYIQNSIQIHMHIPTQAVRNTYTHSLINQTIICTYTWNTGMIQLYPIKPLFDLKCHNWRSEAS
jgi:hypothetical protein